MNDVEFWQLVDEVHAASGGDMTRKCALLAERLIGLDDAALTAFCHHFDRAMSRAYTWPLWGAAYTIRGGCGDDTFMDFRGTLISHGAHVFEAALADPQTLADVPVDDAERLFYEGYQYVGPRVAEQRLGAIPPDPQVQEPSIEPAGEEWDEDDLPAMFPRLSARFQPDLGKVQPAPAIDTAAEPAPRKPWWKLW